MGSAVRVVLGLNEPVLGPAARCRELHRLFTTMEIMRWKEVCEKYESELRNDEPGSSVFSAKTDEGAKRWTDLKARVVEHVSGGAGRRGGVWSLATQGRWRRGCGRGCSVTMALFWWQVNVRLCFGYFFRLAVEKCPFEKIISGKF